MKKIWFLIIMLPVMMLATEDNNNGMSVSLEDAVNMAVSNNLTLKNAGLEYNGTLVNAATSWNTLLPSGGITLTSNFESLQAGLSASINISASKIISIGKSIADYKEGKITYLSAKNKVKKEINELYYYIVLFEKKIELQSSKVAILNGRYKTASLQLATVSISEIDSLTHDIAFKTGGYELRKLKDQYNEAVTTLKNTIGMYDDKKIIFTGVLPEIVDTTTDEKISLQNNNDIALAYSKLQNSKTGTALLIGDLLPSLNLNYSQPVYSSVSSTNFDAASGNLGFSVNIPLQWLLPFSSSQSAIIKNQLAVESYRNNLLATRQNVATQVNTISNSIKRLLDDYETLQLSESLYKSKYQLSVKLYASGSSNYLELKEAENGLFESSLAILNAKYEYAILLLNFKSILNNEE